MSIFSASCNTVGIVTNDGNLNTFLTTHKYIRELMQRFSTCLYLIFYSIIAKEFSIFRTDFHVDRTYLNNTNFNDWTTDDTSVFEMILFHHVAYLNAQPILYDDKIFAKS